MEAAVVNCFSPGDEVLVITMGDYGDRFAKISETFGLHVTRLEVPRGQAANPDEVAIQLGRLPDVRGVLLTQNETSTGVMNDVRTLSHAIRAQRSDVLILVDAVTSIPCVEMSMDEWELDVVLTASQRGWLAPDGLAMIGVSERAWAATEQAKLPRAYWDFRTARTWLEKGQHPFTPPVTVYFGLEAALEILRAEGRAAIIARHHRMGDLARSRARAMGLTLVAELSHASNTVTTIRLPEGIEAPVLLEALREREHSVIVGESLGQEDLPDKIIRIWHLGYIQESDIAACMDAIERQLMTSGAKRPRRATQKGRTPATTRPSNNRRRH
jgi:aspartate aminotransferase-like enzyme